jgi:hypothetical protein
MEWTQEEVQLLGRNRTSLIDSRLSCEIVPPEADLVKFRAQPDKLIALTGWLSLGDKQDATLLNRFQHVADLDGVRAFEDKETCHEVQIDWAKHQVVLPATNKFDECTIRKSLAGDFAVVWMAYERQERYPDDKPALLWITDWEGGKLYQKQARVADAFAGGDLQTTAAIISKFSCVSDALNWANARVVYDAAVQESLGGFNPIV